MEAVEFFKTVNRLCKNQDCSVCPVAKKGRCMAGFDDDSVKNIEEAVSKVEQWAKDHPVKTRQSEFLKMFPRAKVRDGVISLCPEFYCITILGTDFTGCNPNDCAKCLREYWLAEVTGND
jgi:hypothetical protein